MKEEHKRRRRYGFCFFSIGFAVGVFKGFIVCSALNSGLGAIRYELVGRFKRHIGEFSLVTILSLFLEYF